MGMALAFVSGMSALWFAMDLVEWSNSYTAPVRRGRYALVGLLLSVIALALAVLSI